MPKKLDKLELIENEETLGYDNPVNEEQLVDREEGDTGRKEDGGAGVISPEAPVQASTIETKTKAYVYISHFLSAWGDRMWGFGVGLFLINFSPNSLRLTATYGFSKGGVSLLFGALLGNWVDTTPRLKATQIALVLQNILVALCAGVICVESWYRDQISMIWPDKGLLQLCHAVIITLAVLFDMASTTRKISVERDWIVEICARDTDQLAAMSAFMRFIDLFSAILAPALTGLIIAYTELGFGAVLIAGWNLVSVFVEYYFIWKVYDSVPALKVKKNISRKEDIKAKPDKAGENHNEIKKDTQQNSRTHEVDLISSDTQAQSESNIKTNIKSSKEEIKTISTKDSEEEKVHTEEKKKNHNRCQWLLEKLFFSLVTLYKGWRTFMKYEVAYAGLGLAFLHMTVLGFDNITVGYAFSQGLTSDILGGLQAAGAIVGILGTFLYPKVRRCISTERTGLVSLGLQIICLCLCVASVWAPGSPFDISYYWRDDTEAVSTYLGNNSSQKDLNLNLSVVTTLTPFSNSSDLLYSVTDGREMEDVTKTMDLPDSPISIWLLMTGIISARCGLWMADLTITQLFLERVVEDERGIVGGVQSSLNKLMDMLKFMLVIVEPNPPQFGILVIISFAFVSMGWMLYAKFSHAARGHLFHFDKVGSCCDKQNNNIFNNTDVERVGEGDGKGGNNADNVGTSDGERERKVENEISSVQKQEENKKLQGREEAKAVENGVGDEIAEKGDQKEETVTNSETGVKSNKNESNA